MVALAPFGVPLQAFAGPNEPVGGCGSGFQLYSVRYIIQRLAASGFADTIRGYDRNADGFLCVQFLPSFPPEIFSPAFVYTDSNQARGQ